MISFFLIFGPPCDIPKDLRQMLRRCKEKHEEKKCVKSPANLGNPTLSYCVHMASEWPELIKTVLCCFDQVFSIGGLFLMCAKIALIQKEIFGPFGRGKIPGTVLRSRSPNVEPITFFHVEIMDYLISPRHTSATLNAGMPI